MSASAPGGLPPRLREAIEAWVVRSGRTGPARRRLREDLVHHFSEGLAAGRDPDELLRAFGDPEEFLDSLARSVPEPDELAGPGRGVAGALDGIVSDARLAVRSLRSRPLLTALIALVLVMGITATTVALTLVNEVVLKPLPVADQDALINVLADVPGGNSFTGFSVPDFRDLETRNDAMQGLAATSARRLALGERGDAERLVVSLVSPGYFRLLGVDALRGSVELPGFTDWGSDPVIVVSERFWRTRMGGTDDVVGSELRIEGSTWTVIGVAADDFTGTFIGFPTDAWAPLAMMPAVQPGFDPTDRSDKFLELIGRRRAGVTNAAAATDLNRVAAALDSEYPDTNRGHRVRVVSLTGIDESLRAGVFAFTAIIVGVAGVVLLIACLNAGGILLVRSVEREREIAVRIAMGAGRVRLARQVVLEAALIAGLAAVAGLLLSLQVTDLARTFLSVAAGGIGLDLAVDWRVLSMSAAVTVAAAVVAGAAPGLFVTRRPPSSVLRERTASGRGRSLTRDGLVVAQVALSVLLVISAALLARSLVHGLRADPGFDADAVVTFALQPAPDADPSDLAAGRRALLDRLAELPGVASVAAADRAPVGVGRRPTAVRVPGVEPPPGADGHPVDAVRVSWAYLRTLDVDPVRGRTFTRADEASMEPIVIVNEAFADRFLAGVDPVGRSIGLAGSAHRIVGVMPDLRYVLQDPTPDPLLLLPLREEAGAVMIVRAATDPEALAPAVSAAVLELRPGQPAPAPRTVRQTLSDGLVPQRLGAGIVGAMGLVALLLATVGLYGLLLYAVRTEARSLGIRMALGGGRDRIVLTVLRRALVVTGVGGLAGVVVALGVTPVLGPFLAGVRPYDPVTYLGVFGGFVLVAVLAAAQPALRATRIDPVLTLKRE